MIAGVIAFLTPSAEISFMDDNKFKVLLCGEAAVGKTSLIKAYIKAAFEQKYKLTVGVDIFSKEVEVSANEKAILSIWDIGGQERFEFIRSSFYKGAAGVLLVFDMTNPGSFAMLDHWISEIAANTHDPFIVLVGNKIDLLNTCPTIVNKKEIESYLQTKKYPYFETSAKTGSQVEAAFLTLTQGVLKKQ
jgi:small GTP-binding protein